MSVAGWDEPTPKVLPARMPIGVPKRSTPIKKIEFEDLTPEQEETLKQTVARLKSELAESNRNLEAAWEIIRSRDQEIENLQNGAM